MNPLRSSEPNKGSVQIGNAGNLREINRDIASAVIFSSDGYVLMGRKDPKEGGVYPNSWHIPGGGKEEGESLEQTVIREVGQETGLPLSADQLTPVPIVGEGSAVKTLSTGEQVWCKMKFNRFEVRLNKTADELKGVVKPGDDLVELRWFAPNELAHVEQIPGGREFFIQAGYITE